MAVLASAQKTLIDLTDGYTVVLSNESHTFTGTTSAVNGTQTCTSQVQVFQAGKEVSCSVGDITTPTGLSIVSDGKTPSPTLTITATSALTTSGSVTIPVVIGDITISKVFSWSIAFKGASGTRGAQWFSGTGITGTSTTATAFSGSGVSSAIVGDMYLNTSTNNTYRCTVAGAASAAKWVYTGNIKGATGGTGSTGTRGTQWFNGAGITGTSTTATIFSGSGVSSALVGDMYLNTSTGNTYRCTVAGAASAAKWVYTGCIKGATGATGAAGADAITMIIISSNGDIFRNTAIATTLTAHVYKAGAEVTGSDLTALGTIKWYKDGATTATATGSSLTVQAGDVENQVNYTVNLEA